MEITKIIENTNTLLDDWQERTGCDNVTRMKIKDQVLLCNYHNALAEELKLSGINISPAGFDLPETDL